MKRVTFLTLIALAFPASAVEVSRSKVDHPALGTTGGSGLHASIEAIFVKLGDNANSRYEEYSAIADSTTVELDHNFGVNLSELNVLIYSGTGTNLTRITDPESQAPPWTIQEKTGSEKTVIEIITPSSGGPHTFTAIAIHGKGSEKLNDLSDVDVVTAAPEDGQALVYDSGSGNWIPGASGDASFKIQSVTDPNVTIKGGRYALTNRRQLATYDGAGNASTDFFGDITCDLTAILGPSPADNTTYSLFVDLNSVGNTPIITTDTGEQLFPVECSDFALLTSYPDASLGPRYAPVGDIHTADSGNAWSGTGAAFSTHAFRIHDQTYVTVSPTVYSLAEQAIGSVGSSGQIVGGHVLQTDSFGFTFADDIAFFNLQADANDDSGATSCTGGTVACNLTNNGSIPFTATDLFGNASQAAILDGSTQYFSSTDSYFQSTDDISVGGWFYGTTWSGATDDLISQWDSGPNNRSFTIRSDSNGITLLISASGDNSNLGTFVYQPNFNDNTWHHIAFTHDDSEDLSTLYIDGIVVGSLSLALHEPSSARFNIGALDNNPGGSGFDGRVNQVFYADKLLSAEEIRKLASRRIDHNQDVALADQNWLASFNGNLANQLDNGWIIDKSRDSIWFDFFDLASTDSISLKLKNENASAHVLPLNTYDTGFLSAAPSFPLSHGLGSVPAQVAVIHEGQTTAGDYDDVSDKCSWDDTQISCSGLNTVDGSHRLRIVLSTSTVAVAVAEATATDSGIVTTQAQTFAGNKTYNNDVYVSGDLGVGETTPQAKGHFTGTAATSPQHYSAAGVIIEDDTTPALNLVGSANNTGQIIFGDDAAQFPGVIQYKNSSDDMQFSTVGGTAITIDDEKIVGMGTTTPDADAGTALNPSVVVDRALAIGRDSGSTAIEFVDNNATGSTVDRRYARVLGLITGDGNGEIQLHTSNSGAGGVSARAIIRDDGDLEASVDTSGDCGIGNICSGTYNPTVTNVSPAGLNASITGSQVMYHRVGDIVTMSFQFDTASITNTSLEFRITLPFSSDLTLSSDLNGTASTSKQNGGVAYTGRAVADTGADEARILLTKDSGFQNFFGVVTIQYLVK